MFLGGAWGKGLGLSYTEASMSYTFALEASSANLSSKRKKKKALFFQQKRASGRISQEPLLLYDCFLESLREFG